MLSLPLLTLALASRPPPPPPPLGLKKFGQLCGMDGQQSERESTSPLRRIPLHPLLLPPLEALKLSQDSVKKQSSSLSSTSSSPSQRRWWSDTEEARGGFTSLPLASPPCSLFMSGQAASAYGSTLWLRTCYTAEVQMRTEGERMCITGREKREERGCVPMCVVGRASG